MYMAVMNVLFLVSTYCQSTDLAGRPSEAHHRGAGQMLQTSRL